MHHRRNTKQEYSISTCYAQYLNCVYFAFPLCAVRQERKIIEGLIEWGQDSERDRIRQTLSDSSERGDDEMRATHTFAPIPKSFGLAILLLVALAVAVTGVFTPGFAPRAGETAASSTRYSVDPAVRNRRLLELNEGIQPVVKPITVDRNKRLLELNEGYAPDPIRSPRDQRLYELNR
jgi:hypothetical protein